MLEVAQVEHAHRAVSAHRGEDVAATTRTAKRDVVDLFVVRDQLRLDVAGHLGAAKYLIRLFRENRQFTSWTS